MSKKSTIADHTQLIPSNDNTSRNWNASSRPPTAQMHDFNLPLGGLSPASFSSYSAFTLSHLDTIDPRQLVAYTTRSVRPPSPTKSSSDQHSNSHLDLVSPLAYRALARIYNDQSRRPYSRVILNPWTPLTGYGILSHRQDLLSSARRVNLLR